MKVVVAIPLLLTALSKRSAVAQLISPGVPTYSPVNLPPENPGYPSCYVCGPGKVVTIANGVVTPSDKPPTVCGIFQQAGLLGYVDPDLCPMMLDLTENCGCEVGTIAPTVSPSSTPSVIAVIYDPVVAVTMESPSESLGLFTKAPISNTETNAPVVSTNAPIMLTTFFPVVVDPAPVSVAPVTLAVDPAPFVVTPAPVAVDPAPVSVAPVTLAVTPAPVAEIGRAHV